MTFGGGTFTEKNKEIPGVYANFENVNFLDSNITYGTVAFLIPFCSEDGKSTTDTVTITRSEEYSNQLIKFATSDKGGFTLENLKGYCKEIFLNAYNIHLIPMSMKYSSSVYENQEDVTTLQQKLDGLTFNVLLTLDIDNSSVSFGYENTNHIFKDLMKILLENTTTRFQWIVGTDSTEFIANTITDNENASCRKWFVIPYTRAPAPFIAGLLSSIQPGTSAAGKEYNGSVEAQKLAPQSVHEQELALIHGRFCFYTLGAGSSKKIRVLKDITAAHYKENTTDTYSENYNDRMGQILRVQIYLYKYFETIFPQCIQGKPNNARYRMVIKSIILRELRNLEGYDVLEGVQESHVTVDTVENQKDAIQITIQYLPVSGIDYVYLTFLVG